MSEVDPVIHQPTRLQIMMLLSGLRSADFTFLAETLGLSKGNLSSHMNQLERAAYIDVTKSFRGRIPNTRYSITRKGRKRLDAYWAVIDQIRRLRPPEGSRG